MRDILDYESLLERAGGDGDLANEVLLDFVAMGIAEGKAIRAALTGKRFPELASRAHRLRGSLLAIGAGPAADVAKIVELAAKDDRPEAEVANGVAILEDSVDAVLHAINTLTGGQGTATANVGGSR